MAELVDKFIKGQDNVVSVTLTEDGSAISVTFTEIIIYIGPVFSITRSSETAGVTFSNGLLEIVPADLTEDVSVLSNDKHRVYVAIKTATEPSGVLYGADDSLNQIYFEVTNPV